MDARIAPESVTDRQREVARLIAEDKTNREIAEALGISLDGAKYHVSELLGRLGLARREDVGAWYREHFGWRRRLRGVLALPLLPVALGVGGVTVTVAVAVVAVAMWGGSGAGDGTTIEVIQGPGQTPMRASLIASGDGALLVGGFRPTAATNGRDFSDAIWWFDPDTREWREIGSLDRPRAGDPVLAGTDQGFVIAGGRLTSGPSTTVGVAEDIRIQEYRVTPAGVDLVREDTLGGVEAVAVGEDGVIDFLTKRQASTEGVRFDVYRWGDHGPISVFSFQGDRDSPAIDARGEGLPGGGFLLLGDDWAAILDPDDDPLVTFALGETEQALATSAVLTLSDGRIALLGGPEAESWTRYIEAVQEIAAGPPGVDLGSVATSGLADVLPTDEVILLDRTTQSVTYATLAEARILPAASAFADGGVLVTGGLESFEPQGNADVRLWRFDPATGYAEQLGTVPSPGLTGNAVTLADGRVLLLAIDPTAQSEAPVTQTYLVTP